MTKDEVLTAALKIEAKESLLGGDIWVDIENEKYPNGVFVHFKAKELEEGAYGYNETFCIYGYENKLLNGEIETDYRNTLVNFEFTRKELEELIEIKDLPYGVEFLEIMLKRNSQHYQKLNDLYTVQNNEHKELSSVKSDLTNYVKSIDDDIKVISRDDERELEVLQNVRAVLDNILNKSNKNSNALDEIKKEMNAQAQEKNLDQVQSKAHDELATNSNIRKNK